MGRLGWAILGIVALALAAYVLWPDPSADDRIAVYDGPVPTAYRVQAGGIEQEVDGAHVTIAGVRLALDREKHDALWGFVASLRGGVKQVVTGGEALDAYGLGGGREVAATGVRLRWGSAGGSHYLWEGLSGRLFVIDRALRERLDTLTRRLDRPVVASFDAVRRIEVAGLSLVMLAGDWRDEVRGGRPPLTRQVAVLAGLVEAVRIDDLAGKAPVGAPEVVRLRLRPESEIAPGTEVVVWKTADGGTVQVDALPAQRLDAATVAAWTEAAADLWHDRLFNLAREFALKPLVEVIVSRGGKELFHLEKHGLRDEEYGMSMWDVVWPGGREVADAGAAARIALAADELRSNDARPRGAEAPPADAIVIDFVFQVTRNRIPLVIAGDEVWSPTHRGRVKLPEDLALLTPERQLDLRLASRDPRRAIKLQRVVAGRGEVVVADAPGAAWRRTFPAEVRGQAVDALAVERVVRILCAARARSARAVGATDRLVLEKPEFELDLRFAPVASRRSNDQARLDDSDDSELGLAFAREGDGWRAVDKEGTVSWLVDAELVEQLRAPFDEGQVLPVAPSLVQRIEVVAPGRRLYLFAGTDGWSLRATGADGRLGAARPADPVQVRRYLRTLTGLMAERRDGAAGPLQPDESAGSVSLILPGRGEDEEQLVLGIAKPVAGQVALTVDGTAVRVPRGRAYVPIAAAADLLPAPDALAPAAAPAVGK